MSNAGRKPILDDESKQEVIYNAIEAGLSPGHAAAAAGVSRRTLSRYACCIENLKEGIIEVEEGEQACEFCRGYAQAHSKGAKEVLSECRPEFRAAACFGYVKTEGRDVNMNADLSFDEIAEDLREAREMDEDD